MIYLNETMTVQPSKLDAYVRDFSTELVPVFAKYDIQLLGLFQTWRTNELRAFWELKDHAALDQLDKVSKEDEALIKYTMRAMQSRLSFSNRILSPTKFCPDLARIKKEGLKGGVYMLATIPIVPEKMNEYFDLFPQFGLRFEERYGLKTVGDWRGGGGEPYQSEAFFGTQLCAGESWAFWARFGVERNKDPEVQAWMARALNYRTHHRISYLVPAFLTY